MKYLYQGRRYATVEDLIQAIAWSITQEQMLRGRQ
jgi:hypothetical protein